MARFELNIYGVDDEILKTYATDKVRYGAFEEAVKFTEESEGKKQNEVTALTYKTVKNIIKNLFPTITDDEIKLADFNDMVNLTWQISGKISAPLAENAEEGEKN